MSSVSRWRSSFRSVGEASQCLSFHRSAAPRGGVHVHGRVRGSNRFPFIFPPSQYRERLSSVPVPGWLVSEQKILNVA